VKVWLKGMKPDAQEPAFGTADDEPRIHRDRLSCGIVLDETALGWIAIWRGKIAFSRIDVQLLRSTETQVDQYVRDLWEEQLIREIDHDVFNNPPVTMGEFAEKLIKELVRHFEAAAGTVQIQNHDDASYIASEELTHDEIGKIERVMSTLSNTLRAGERSSSSETTQDGYYRLFQRLSIEDKPLGGILLLGRNRFTRVHREGLKRLEAQVDNILQLYLNLEEHYGSRRN
jgi:hypothetical protein